MAPARASSASITTAPTTLRTRSGSAFQRSPSQQPGLPDQVPHHATRLGRRAGTQSGEGSAGTAPRALMAASMSSLLTTSRELLGLSDG